MMTSAALRQLRIVAWLEGLALIALLFVAMPLKYGAGVPLAVSVAGAVHGVLFLLFLLTLAEVAMERGWPRRLVALAVVAAAVPFGTLLIDRRWR